MRNEIRSIFIILILTTFSANICTTGLSQQIREEKKSTLNKQELRSFEIENFINEARVLPVEFSADLLIKIASSGKIKNKQTKQDLLEEAFYKASSVQSKIKRNNLPGTMVDTRTGYLGSAYRLKLDELSLKSRAIRELLTVNVVKARELFIQIPKPNLQALNCEDLLVNDVSDFYELLGVIAHQAFTPEEIKREEHLFLLQSYISNITSPAQIAPVAKMILTFNKSPNHFAVLLSSFTRILPKTSDDTRSFAAVAYSIVQSVGELAKTCDDLSISNSDISKVLRDYLIKEFSGSHCEGCLVDTEVKSLVQDFNKILITLKQAEPVKVSLIAEEEIKSSKTEKTAKPFQFWQSVQAKSLLMKIRHLRFGSENKQLTSEEKNSLAWQKELADFLRDLDNWQMQSEKLEADYFHQKCVLYNGLLDLTSGVVTDKTIKVISEYVVFLRDSSMQQDKPIEWFWHASRVVEVVGKFQGKDAVQVQEILTNNSGSIIRAYAAMKKLEGKVETPQPEVKSVN